MNGICLNWQRVGTHPLRPLPLRSLRDDAWFSVKRQHSNRIDKIVEQRIQAHQIQADNSEDICYIYYEDPKEPDYLDYCGWSVISRSTYEAPYTSYVTVLIVAPWDAGDETMADTWCKAAFDIKHHLDCELLWSHGIDLKVEIIAPERLMPNQFAPVTGREDLDRDWELIRETVRRKIERYEQVRMSWNCIALFSHGIHKRKARNPPTVYITMARTCDEYEWNWDLRRDIQEYLDQSGHGLKLHMDHCAIDSFGTMAMKEPVERPHPACSAGASISAALITYDKTVSMGAEISASTDIITTLRRSSEEDQDQIQNNPTGEAREIAFNPPVGTLGCYVQIQGGDEQWKTYALTNYHTIRPAIPGFRCDARGDLVHSEPESELRRIDREGLRPDEKIMIGIESPSRTIHQQRIKGLEVMRKKDPEAKQWEKAITEKSKFFDQEKHIFGHLYAASGCGYGKDGAVLDWALIDVVPGRMGENRLPDLETWPMEQYEHRPPFGLDSLGQPADLADLYRGLESIELEPEPGLEVADSPSIRDMMLERKQAREAYQLGATGNSTTGEISARKAAVRWGPDDVLGTKESVFVRKGVPGFMLRPDSDSGSVLYNKEGRALGMLLGTRQPNQPRSEGAFFFVTPMEDILGHIAFMLGIESTAVRIAEL